MNENTEINDINAETRTEPTAFSAEKKSLFQRFRFFCKSNSDMIVKLYVHQFGLAVFGFLLYSASSASGNKPLVLGLGIFSAAFYLFLLYVLSWDVGARDKIKIDGGRLKRDNLKGSRVAIIGMLPNLFIATLALVGFIFKGVGAWAKVMYGTCQVIGVYLNVMYLGIDEYIGFAVNPAYLYIICLPAILICGLGYYFGSYERFGILTSRPMNGGKRR